MSEADGASETRGVESQELDGGERGKTFIVDSVVSTIARIAAEQVEGVHRIGESTFRALMSRRGLTGGIASEVGLKEAAIDVNVVVEYGYPIKEVATALRRTVIDSVERMTGRQVVEVNVHIVDIHIPKVHTEQRQRRQLE